jgi:hypothetical protein
MQIGGELHQASCLIDFSCAKPNVQHCYGSLLRWFDFGWSYTILFIHCSRERGRERERGTERERDREKERGRESEREREIKEEQELK